MSNLTRLEHRFVAFFDIIGFRALRRKLGTLGLYQRYQGGVAPAIQHSAARRKKLTEIEGETVYLPDFSNISVGYRTVSDTAIFFTNDDSFTSFLRIVDSSFRLLQSGFGGGNMPYRGAIGYGDLIIDPNGILIGGAIEDAYSGENSQVWAGAMLTPSCLEFAASQDFIDSYKEYHMEISNKCADEIEIRAARENSLRLVEYSVPIYCNPKNSKALYSYQKTYAIDWTIRMYQGASEMSFNPSDNSHAQRIASNTIRFEQWARNHNK